MKRHLLYMAVLGTFLSVSGKTFYVVQDEDMSRAFSSLIPGDTLFISPGIYHIKPSDISRKTESGPYAVVYDLSVSGEKGKPIVIKGLLDEIGNRPIFDFSEVMLRDDENPEGYRITGFMISGSYLHISDLESTGIKVIRTDHTQSENFRINGGSYNTLENISCHDGMGIGVYINGDSNYNLIVNCDAYNNYDPVSDISKRTGEGSGGNNDGFGCHVKGGMDGNVFIGCRAWRNSDDGFDLINCYAPVTVSYCIAMENGFDAQGNNRADGNGVKGGGFGMKSRNVPLHDGISPQHSIRNNLAFANKSHGIYSNHHLGGIVFESNTAINNGRANFSMVNRKGPEKDNNVDVDGYGHAIMRNLSLSADGRHYLWIESAPSDREILRDEITEEYVLIPLFAPRGNDGKLSEESISFIQSFRKDGSGADFSGYVEAIDKARRVSGCDAE